jgi:hypothetical protein
MSGYAGAAYTVVLPDELSARLCLLARAECRTPEQQASWMLQRALRGDRRLRVSTETRRAFFGPLLAELRQLYEAAGRPSTREIAARSGGLISHTAVHQVLTDKSVPGLFAFRAICTGLGGDAEALCARYKETMSDV